MYHDPPHAVCSNERLSISVTRDSGMQEKVEKLKKELTELNEKLEKFKKKLSEIRRLSGRRSRKTDSSCWMSL